MAKKYYYGTLSTYQTPLEGGFHKNDIIKACTERVELYKLLNNVLEGAYTPEWVSSIENEILPLCVHFNRLLTSCDEEELRIDYLSFWYLIIAYSRRNRESQKYFLERELEWFHFRYLYNSEEICQDFSKSNFNIQLIDNNDKQQLKNLLIANEPNISDNFTETNIYRIDWTKCPSIVRNRELLLIDGVAYFSKNLLLQVVKSCLEKKWTKHLKIAFKCLDSRVLMLINNLPIPKIGPNLTYLDYNEITLENINEQAVQHFPLCSLYLHSRLRANHHLKYDSKMQLGVFLYTIGMSYTDALSYWRQEFTKKMSLDFYNRKYEYLFKHQYGMVGRKMPYEPYSCDYVIGMKVGPMQDHGCPYRTFSHDRLKWLLGKFLPIEECNEIINLVSSDNYTEACTAFFNFTHKNKLNANIENPHDYYFRSKQCGNCSQSCSSKLTDW